MGSPIAVLGIRTLMVSSKAFSEPAQLESVGALYLGDQAMSRSTGGTVWMGCLGRFMGPGGMKRSFVRIGCRVPTYGGGSPTAPTMLCSAGW